MNTYTQNQAMGKTNYTLVENFIKANTYRGIDATDDFTEKDAVAKRHNELLNAATKSESRIQQIKEENEGRMAVIRFLFGGLIFLLTVVFISLLIICISM